MVAMATLGPEHKRATNRSHAMKSYIDLERLAHQMLAQHCHFHGRDRGLEIAQRDDVLVIRGCVPTFYLKQVLQTALMGLDGVRWVDNQVDVVACDGLSSVPAKSHSE